MLGGIAAVEFTIDRPETALEFAVLAAIAVTILFVITRGLQSVTGTFQEQVTKLFWVIVGLLAFIYLFSERPWERDPLVQGELEVVPVNGVHAETDPGHHNDDGETTYDTGN